MGEQPANHLSMEYSSNIGNASASALHEPKYNHASGQVTVTPDQLGVSITKSVFGWKYPSSGIKASNSGDMGTNTAASQYIDTYGLPFKFVVNGNQILLPPVVTKGGTPVPYLPDGLTVVYASSFMGVTIPSDFCRPIAVNGKLRISPLEMPSAQGWAPRMSSRSVGSWTNDIMINNGVDNGVNKGETLLRILMSVMECLIYSYSSYPWGNNYNDLSGAIMTKRNMDDFLIYPQKNGGFFSNVLNAIGSILANPAVQSGLNSVEPGAGTAAGVVGNQVKGATGSSSNSQIIGSGMTTQYLPQGTDVYDQNGNLISTTATSLSPTLLIIAAIVIIIIIVIIARS